MTVLAQRSLPPGAGARLARAATLLLAAAFLGGARPPQRLGPLAPAEPRRIVALAPSLTDTVVALGASARLVGVTRFDAAAEVAALPRVGGYADPSVEAVLALRPELALVEPAPGNRAAVERLASLGVPVLAVPLGDVDEILQGIGVVGAALGVTARAEALAADLRARLARSRQQAQRLEPVRALIVYGWEPMVVAGPGSFADRLLRDSGGLNAAPEDAGGYPVLSAELAVACAPTVIVDASGAGRRQRTRLLGLPGLAQARLVEASENLFLPGPRIATALEELIVLLHGGAARAESSSPPARQGARP